MQVLLHNIWPLPQTIFPEEDEVVEPEEDEVVEPLLLVVDPDELEAIGTHILLEQTWPEVQSNPEQQFPGKQILLQSIWPGKQLFPEEDEVDPLLEVEPDDEPCDVQKLFKQICPELHWDWLIQFPFIHKPLTRIWPWGQVQELLVQTWPLVQLALVQQLPFKQTLLQRTCPGKQEVIPLLEELEELEELKHAGTEIVHEKSLQHKK